MKPPRNERESHAELVARIERESDAAMRMARGSLKRGVNGVCGRSVCICARDGLGDECIWLRHIDAEAERITGEPHIDGYPLYSVIPPPRIPCNRSAIGLLGLATYLVLAAFCVVMLIGSMRPAVAAEPLKCGKGYAHDPMCAAYEY